jgi:hypothetical protein
MSRALTFLATAALLLVGFTVAVPAQAAEPITTTVAVTIENADDVGGTFTVFATVTSASGTPTGAVTFSGSVPTTTVPLDGMGKAHLYGQNTELSQTVTATFTGSNGYGNSSDTVTAYAEKYVDWDPEPTIARLGPGLKLTLTMATHLHDRDGQPMAGTKVAFTLLAKTPSFYDYPPKPSLNVCTAVADANGFATCKGNGLVGSVLSLVLGGAYATVMDGPFPSEYQFTKLPVIRVG